MQKSTKFTVGRKMARIDHRFGDRAQQAVIGNSNSNPCVRAACVARAPVPRVQDSVHGTSQHASLAQL
jgi:hypothetical protein